MTLSKTNQDYMNSEKSILGMRVSDLVKMPLGHFKFSPIYKSNEFIGAEFEIEGVDLPRPASFSSVWSVKSDGSLRYVREDGSYVSDDEEDYDRYRPFEYVLKRPLSPDNFKSRALPLLFRKLDASGSKPHFSVRTSVHIHIGVHELRVYQVYAMVAAYYTIEDLLGPLTGVERDGNLFCINGANGDIVIDSLLNSIVKGFGYPDFSQNMKYTAVNLLTLYNLGTVEFRAMEGTLDPHRLTTWVDILTALRTWAASLKPNEVGLMMNMLSLAGPSEFVSKIMGGYTSEAFLALKSGAGGSISRMNEMIYNGISRAQPLVYEPNWQDLVDKEYEAPKKEEITAKSKKRPIHGYTGLNTESITPTEWIATATWSQPLQPLPEGDDL